MLRTLIICILTVFMGSAAMAQTVEDLMQADRDFSAQAQNEGVRNAFLATSTDQSVMLNGGQDIIDGDGAVQESLAQWPDGINLSWEPVGGMIASSGDLGFTYGRYLSWGDDEDGNRVENHGKYVTIWQRQDDGTWKWVLDGGNPSPAPGE